MSQHGGETLDRELRLLGREAGWMPDDDAVARGGELIGDLRDVAIRQVMKLRSRRTVEKQRAQCAERVEQPRSRGDRAQRRCRRRRIQGSEIGDHWRGVAVERRRVAYQATAAFASRGPEAR